jgi:hypothetical protein
MGGSASKRPQQILEPLVGAWEVTTRSGERTMSTFRVTFGWLDGRGLLVQRQEPPTYLVPEWVGAAPEWADSVIGFDDYSEGYTVLYVDSRGVYRTYRMALEGNRWTLESRPAADFHQRFGGTFSDDGSTIDGGWEASANGETWSTDFDVTFRRLDD